MITFTDNKLSINEHNVFFPIRIKQIVIVEDFILVALGFDATLDCGYIDKWTQQIDDKWNELHKNNKNPTLFCFDKLGNLKWEFKENGFFNISKLDNNAIDNDLRVKYWVQSNPDKCNIFIVYGDDKLLVDYKTGEIYNRLEMR